MGAKIAGLGLYKWASARWNIYDMVLVWLAILTSIPKYYGDLPVSMNTFTMFRIYANAVCSLGGMYLESCAWSVSHFVWLNVTNRLTRCLDLSSKCIDSIAKEKCANSICLGAHYRPSFLRLLYFSSSLSALALPFKKNSLPLAMGPMEMNTRTLGHCSTLSSPCFASPRVKIG